MPLYEYQCPKCGRFEVIRKFSDKPLKKCPTCGRAIQKLASAPAIQFKGTGWYVTDYAKSGAKAKKDDGKPDQGTKEGSGKTEAASTASDAGASKAAAASSKEGPAAAGGGHAKSGRKKP